MKTTLINDAARIRVAAGVAGVLVAALLPGVWGIPSAAVFSFVLRGLIAGGVVGITVRNRLSPGFTIALAASSALIGGLIAAFALELSGAAPIVACVAFAAVSCAAVVWLVPRFGMPAISLVLLAIISLGFLWNAGLLPGPVRDATAGFRSGIEREPVAEVYGFDGYLYLKTYHLMERGTPFYAAFAQAFDEDSRLEGAPKSLFNYREPWVFWLWVLLPGGTGLSVWGAHLLFSLAVMASGYHLARRFVEPGPALLAPVMLSSYMLFPALSAWFPFTEYWGGGLAVLALGACVRERWFSGALLLTAAVACRELMVFLVPVFVLGWILYPRRRDQLPAVVLALLGPVAVIAFHALQAPVGGAPSGLSTWMNGGMDRLLEAVRFSSQMMPNGGVALPAAAVLASLAGFFVHGWWRRGILVASLVVPLFALFTFSSGEWGYYWGAIVMPLVLALVPLVFVPLAPSARHVADRWSPAPGGKIRIVIPARNAAATIEQTIAATASALETSGRSWAVLLMDDGSTDDTAAVATRAAQGLPITVKRSERPMGLGAAAHKGLTAALRAAKSGDVVGLVDGAATEASGLANALSAWSVGSTQAVRSSRFQRGMRPASDVRGWNRTLAFVSQVVLSVALPAEGVRDHHGSTQLYDADALRIALGRSSQPPADQSGYDLWLLAATRSDVSVAEVPGPPRGHDVRDAWSGLLSDVVTSLRFRLAALAER